MLDEDEEEAMISLGDYELCELHTKFQTKEFVIKCFNDNLYLSKREICDAIGDITTDKEFIKKLVLGMLINGANTKAKSFREFRRYLTEFEFNKLKVTAELIK